MKRGIFICILVLLSSIFCFIFVSKCFKNTSSIETDFSFLKYDVEIQDKNVGWMTCKKMQSVTDPTLTDYLIDSKVSITIVTNYLIQFNSLSTFKQSSLYKANYATKVNGDTQSFSSITWDGNRYKGWDGKKTIQLESEKITYSIGNIYYKEPLGQTQIFSEKYMAMCPISKTGDFYTVSFPDGKSTLYKYQNGICIWAESKQKLYKITFRLKEIK